IDLQCVRNFLAGVQQRFSEIQIGNLSVVKTDLIICPALPLVEERLHQTSNYCRKNRGDTEKYIKFNTLQPCASRYPQTRIKLCTSSICKFVSLDQARFGLHDVSPVGQQAGRVPQRETSGHLLLSDGGAGNTLGRLTHKKAYRILED